MSSSGWLRNKLIELWSIDTRSLALFRIALGLVLLADVAGRLIDLEGLYGAEGVQPVAVVRQHLQDHYPSTWSLHLVSDSSAYQVSLLALAAGLAIALIAGWRTELAALGSWVLLASLHARSPLVTNGGDVLLRMMLLWALFLPLASRWSRDARRTAAGHSPATVCSVASVAALLQVCLMYEWTGLFKWNDVWLSGEALDRVLSLPLYATAAGQALRAYPQALRVMTWLALGLELLGPWLLFFPWKTTWVRGLTVLVLAGMHGGIELTMHVDLFSVACWTALTLFVPSGFWDWLGGWARPAADPPAAPPAPLPARRTDTQRRRLLATTCGCLLTTVVLFNLADLALRWNLWSGPIPAGMHRVVQLAALDQRWDMFRAGGGPDSRLLAFAELVNGTELDLLRNAPPSEDLGELDPAFPPRRWALFVTELRREANAAFRLPTAQFLIRRWDRQHPPEQRVRRLVLLLLREPVGTERGDKAVIYLELEVR